METRLLVNNKWRLVFLECFKYCKNRRFGESPFISVKMMLKHKRWCVLSACNSKINKVHAIARAKRSQAKTGTLFVFEPHARNTLSESFSAYVLSF